jgi:anaerobic selenocysteine-containing dehydrogenase
MGLNRRQFLTLMGGSAGAAVLFQACGLPEEELLIDAPIEMPEDLVTGLDNWYATTLPGGFSEGLLVRVMEGRAKKVEGNPDYPINLGKHGPLSEASLQALYHPDRISGPMVRTGARGSGEYSEISWDDAVTRLTHQLAQFEGSGEQDKVVLLTNPIGGHLAQVVNSFVSSIGARHLTYEILETSVVQDACKHVFGQDRIPDFDISHSDYLLSFGSDFLSTWISPTRYAAAYGNFRQGGHRRGKLVHIDSRFSMTAANADVWIPVNPGTEGLLAMGIIRELVNSGEIDSRLIKSLLGDDGNWLDSYSANNVASLTGVSAEQISQIANDFNRSDHALAIGGGSAAAHTNGLENMKAVYSLNHLVGNIGKEGGVIFNPEFPIEGISSEPKVNSFRDMWKLSDDMSSGNVKVLMLRDVDPYYGLPDSMRFKQRIENVDLIVSFSNMMDDTTSMADLILPQNNPLEDWGTDIPKAGPGYEMIGFQQPVVRPFFENRGENLGTKGFGDVLLTAAQVMEKDLGFEGSTFKEIIMESARQLYNLKRGSVSASSFEGFWNGVLQRGGWWDTAARENSKGIPTRLDGVSEPMFIGSGEFFLQPFASSSMLDGRGASLPWLQAMPDPISTATWQTWIEINHVVAEKKGIKEGDVIEITSSNGGKIIALAMPNPATPPDVLGVPLGQGHRDGGRYSSGRGANVLSILDPAYDGGTGSLAWASTKVDITPTGEWMRVPKFENTVPDFPRDEDNHIIELTSGDAH